MQETQAQINVNEVRERNNQLFDAFSIAKEALENAAEAYVHAKAALDESNNECVASLRARFEETTNEVQ